MGEQSGIFPIADEQDVRRRVVVILFADVISSTHILAPLDPEDAREIMGGAVERMTAAVHAFGGVVARVQGDGVLALFGAKATSEDDALRACLAGLSMAESFREAPAPTGLRAPLAVRIGIHAGQVVLHQTKNDMGANGDVSGLPVHIAAKIEQICTPNDVFISEDALGLVIGDVEALSSGTVDAGGNSPKIHVARLVSVSPEFTLQKQFTRRWTIPMVGRAAEMSLVYDMMRDAPDVAGCVGIVADAGMGKSRLSLEIQRLAQSMDMPIAEVRGVSYLRSTSYGALTGFILTQLRLSFAASRTQIADAVDALQGPEEHIAALRDMLALEQTHKAYLNLEPRDRTSLCARALVTLLSSLEGDQPILLLIEDVHEMDDASRQVIRDVVRREDNRPVVTVLTGRTPAADFIDSLASQTIRLAPLSNREAHALVTAMRGRLDVPSSLEAEAITRAAGNPFILVEYLRSLSGKNRTNSDSLPVSIEALVQARMEHLSAGARSLLKLLSIADGSLHRRICEHLSDPAALQDSIDELLAAGFLNSADGDTLDLQHALLSAGCRNSLLKAERRNLHALLLDAFESLGADDLPLERVAWHARHSGALHKALDYTYRACRLEIQRGSVVAVTKIFRRATVICDEIGPDADAMRVDLLFRSFDALHQQGEFELINRELKRADSFADVQRNEVLKAQSLTHLAFMAWLASDHGVAKAQSTMALTVLEALGRFPLKMYAISTKANAEHGLGNVDAAIDLHLSIVAALDGSKQSLKLGGLGMPAIVSRAFVIWYKTQRGEIAQALQMIAQGLIIAAEESQPYSLIMMYTAAGLNAFARGETSRALETFRASYDLCTDEKIDAMACMAAASLTQALVRAGAFASAFDVIEEASESGVYSRGGQCTWVRFHIARSEALQATGNADSALDEVNRAVTIASDNAEPVSEAIARLARGDLYVRAGDSLEEARQDFRAVAALAARHHLPPLAAYANAGLAFAYTIEGNPLAHVHRLKAETELSELGLEAIAHRFSSILAHVTAGEPCEWYNFAV